MSPAHPAELRISAASREVLTRVATDQITRSQDARRANALLMAADGVANATLAPLVGASPTTTRAWRRAFEERGLASLAPVPGDRGRRGTIPGLRLATAVAALSRNSHASEPASSRQLARELNVSTVTLRRLRADLRIDDGTGRVPHHHLAEVVGVLIAPPVAAVAVALDPTTHRAFMRSRRGPHLTGSCPGGLVAAMAATDVLRATAPRATVEESMAAWRSFLTSLVEQRPPGAHLHVVATGPSETVSTPVRQRAYQERSSAVPSEVTGDGNLLRIRRTPMAAWSHGRLTMIARMLRTAGGRSNLTALPALLAALDAALGSASERTAPSPGTEPGTTEAFSWVADRTVAETAARRSRAEVIERTRLF